MFCHFTGMFFARYILFLLGLVQIFSIFHCVYLRNVLHVAMAQFVSRLIQNHFEKKAIVAYVWFQFPLLLIVPLVVMTVQFCHGDCSYLKTIQVKFLRAPFQTYHVTPIIKKRRQAIYISVANGGFVLLYLL